jgi:thioredoxin reductase (NADPH)
MLTTEVDNFPGFPEGVMGPDLMTNMKKQAERFNAELVFKNATEINVENRPFKVTAEGTEYLANSIIIATGADTKWLGIEGEEKLRGRGVSSCAPCDAPFFKDKRVAVIGGGDSAMEEALVLTKYASEVNLIHRKGSFKASEAMQQKVKANEKIKIVWNTEIRAFLGEQKLEKLKIFNNIENTESEIEMDGAFVAIGHVPSTSVFKGKINLDQTGYIEKQKKDGYDMATSVDGIFVAGDVHDIHYRQAVTAAAFGCMAGMEVLKYLDKSAPSY